MTLFKKKRSKTGTIERWKARLVVHSFEINSFDTYAFVARMTSFRVIYILSVYLHLFIESMSMDVAFLNPELKEDLYIERPAG